jgi:hypothetical protein
MTTPRLLLSALLIPLFVPPSEAQRVAPVALRASDAPPLVVAAPAAAPTSAPFLGAPVAIARDTVPEPVPEISTVGTVVGGVIGGVAGTFLGAVIGAGATSGCQGDLCGLEGALLGVLVGEPLGLGIGSHIGSRSRTHGNIALTSLTSVAILVGGVIAGVGMGHAAGPAGMFMIPLTPALQLATAVAIETH